MLNNTNGPFPKIGVVGVGFVGEAVVNSYRGFSEIVTVDTDPAKFCTGTYDDLLTCEGVFICVPSPAKPDGGCDTTILESVLENFKDYKGVLISKVTAPPDVYTKLSKQYINLVYVPEFLTAANATRDYLNSTFTIIGGTVRAYMHEASKIIMFGQTNCLRTDYCTIEEAALTKYAINSYLATKVIFMNELLQLAEANQINFDYVALMMRNDLRIGSSHMHVPGADGKFGFGGMCFPKDTAALLKYAEDSNSDLSILSAATKKNTLLRLS